jgi:hypothetical protein
MRCISGRPLLRLPVYFCVLILHNLMILGFYCSDCVNETLFLCFLLSTKIEMDTIHPDSFLLVDVMGIIFGRWQATAAAGKEI